MRKYDSEIFGNKCMTIVLTTALAAAFVLLPSVVSAAEPLKESPNVSLRALITELKPSVYLTDNKVAVYGESAPLVLFADVQSLPLLYSARRDFATVELIQVTISNASEERATIDMARLGAFPALEYIVFVYAYPACGNSENMNCLDGKVSAAVVNQPSDSEVKIFYHLSIPE